MAKMISRVPLNAVIVQRDGKNVRAAAGTAFDFTEEEVKQLGEMDEKRGRTTLRQPVNEAAVDPKAAAVKAKAEAHLAELVKKSGDADAAAAAKSSDTKLAERAAAAKEAVRKHCDATGLEVPKGFEAAEL